MLAQALTSGSSFDGIDTVPVDIEVGEDGFLRRPRFVAGKPSPEATTGRPASSRDAALDRRLDRRPVDHRLQLGDLRFYGRESRARFVDLRTGRLGGRISALQVLPSLRAADAVHGVGFVAGP